MPPPYGEQLAPDFYYDFTTNEGNKNFAIAYNDMMGKEFVWGSLFVYIKMVNLSDCYKITSIKGKKNSYSNKMNSFLR